MFHSMDHMVSELFVWLGIQSYHIFQFYFHCWRHGFYNGGSDELLSVFCLFLDPFPVPLSNVLVVSGCRWWGSQFPSIGSPLQEPWVCLHWVFSPQCHPDVMSMLSKEIPSSWGLSTAWRRLDCLRMSFILEAPRHFASRALISPRARSFPTVSSSNVLINFPAPSCMSGRRETKVSRSWPAQGIYWALSLLDEDWTFKSWGFSFSWCPGWSVFLPPSLSSC